MVNLIRVVKRGVIGVETGGVTFGNIDMGALYSINIGRTVNYTGPTHLSCTSRHKVRKR
jgi:hypothetical protein